MSPPPLLHRQQNLFLPSSQMCVGIEPILRPYSPPSFYGNYLLLLLRLGCFFVCTTPSSSKTTVAAFSCLSFLTTVILRALPPILPTSVHLSWSPLFLWSPSILGAGACRRQITLTVVLFSLVAVVVVFLSILFLGSLQLGYFSFCRPLCCCATNTFASPPTFFPVEMGVGIEPIKRPYSPPSFSFVIVSVHLDRNFKTISR